MSAPYAIHDVAQGSDAWHDLRRGKVTGSTACRVVGRPRSGAGLAAAPSKALARALADEQAGEFAESVDFANGEHGHDAEPRARMSAELLTGVDFPEVGFVERNRFHGHSPDGFNVREGVGLEVKSPVSGGIHVLLSMMPDASELKRYSPAYYWQCVNGLLVCDARAWLFGSYRPGAGGWPPLYLLAITREEVAADIDHLAERVDAWGAARAEGGAAIAAALAAAEDFRALQITRLAEAIQSPLT